MSTSVVQPLLNSALLPSHSAYIPAEQLYWGQVPREAADGDAMRFRFERVLPIPVEQVHVTSTSLADGSCIVVGIEPDRLRTYLTTRPDIMPGTWTLVPDRLPQHLSSLAGSEEAHLRLNLLHGPFEPAPRLRMRRLTAGILHLGLAICLLLIIIGTERRVHVARQYTMQQRDANVRGIQQIIPPQTGMRPETQLTMALRRLDQAQRNSEQQPSDIAAVLQALWEKWPKDKRVQIDLCSAQGDRIIIRGRTTSLADAELFARALETITVPQQPYLMEPLQAQQDGLGASFLLAFERVPHAGVP